MLTTTDVCKVYGIHIERLRDWLKKGYVHYTVDPKGQGTIGFFSTNGVIMVGIFIRLLETHTRKAASRLAYYPYVVPGIDLWFDTYFVITYSNMRDVMNSDDTLCCFTVCGDREMEKIMTDWGIRGMYKYNEVRVYCLEPIIQKLRDFYDERNKIKGGD